MNVGWGTVVKRAGENEVRLLGAIFVGREAESKTLTVARKSAEKLSAETGLDNQESNTLLSRRFI